MAWFALFLVLSCLVMSFSVLCSPFSGPSPPSSVLCPVLSWSVLSSVPFLSCDLVCYPVPCPVSFPLLSSVLHSEPVLFPGMFLSSILLSCPVMSVLCCLALSSVLFLWPIRAQQICLLRSCAIKDWSHEESHICNFFKIYASNKQLRWEIHVGSYVRSTWSTNCFLCASASYHVWIMIAHKWV